MNRTKYSNPTGDNMARAG